MEVINKLDAKIPLVAGGKVLLRELVQGEMEGSCEYSKYRQPFRVFAMVGAKRWAAMARDEHEFVF